MSINVEKIIKLYASGVRDFSDSQYDEADLSGVNLSNSNLSCVSMVRADLSGADLSFSNLKAANLSGANFSDADLSEADLTEANLREANLWNANLSFSNLKAANLSGANFSDVDLSETDLTEANLREANLCNANLSFSNLKAANLEKADLRGVVDLEYAEYDETTKFPEGFDPSSYKGIWLNADTFIKYEWIDYVKISKNWDRFSDAMADIGLGEEVLKLLRYGDGDCYSYRYDIQFNDIKIRVSDLDNLAWDYLKINLDYRKIRDQKFPNDIQLNGFSRDIEDAIECGEVNLVLFLYT